MSVRECPACGHTKGKEWNDGDLEEINTDADEFIHIEGSFHYEQEGGYRSTQKKEVDLYGCPECDNVIFETRI